MYMNSIAFPLASGEALALQREWHGLCLYPSGVAAKGKGLLLFNLGIIDEASIILGDVCFAQHLSCASVLIFVTSLAKSV